ncbi:MAG: XRE family transcriptional regulator [Gammaproteobacteria bacterium]|nr:MAG: XRE family transcriptional regulator [Gammaproteobacteria bacterium]
MIIQKLRLQRGWSQQQLAEMSGLSTRTIQRIENGRTPSVESVKSLAAVFEVNFSTLQGALAMNTEKQTTQIRTDNNENQSLQLTETERQAYNHVRKLKNFYRDLTVFAVIIVFLAGVNWLSSPNYWWVIWVFLGWGLSFVIRSVKLFFKFPLFDAEWEKRQVEQYLNKKR